MYLVYAANGRLNSETSPLTIAPVEPGALASGLRWELNRRVKTMSTSKNEADYSALRQRGLLSGTIKSARAKRAQREDRRWVEPDYKPWHGHYRLIPLGQIDEVKVDRLARADRPRVRRWESALPADKTVGDPPAGWGVSDIDMGRYSSRCTFAKIDHHPYVHSYGYATATWLVATIWNKRYRYRAPRGWVYGIDGLGIYVRRAREKRERYRYHLSSDDVRGGLSAMRAAGLQHETEQIAATKRERQRRKIDKIKDAEIERYGGVWVTLADSRAAGNCASGTKTWALRHGLNPKKRYPLRVIERLAKTHQSVERVLAIARRRTRTELEQGFCLIDARH